jgi:hypothetical protein
LRNHGQIFGPLDPIRFSATMVRHRSVALPSLFPRPRSRADPYRAPCGNRWIAPRAPTSVSWDDRCVPLDYKKRNPSAVLPLPSLACSRVRPCRHPYFSFRIVWANPLLVHCCCYFAHSPSKLISRLRRPPPEEARRRPKEEPRLHR